MNGSPWIDVARLPSHAFDTRSPGWWGNTLLLVIESMTLALLVATYFYLARNFSPFPPPRVLTDPPLREPLPKLAAATFDVLLEMIAVVPIVLADKAVRRGEARTALLGSLGAAAALLGSLALRPAELRAVHVGWDANAYGSIVWALLVMHTLYVVVALAEFAFLAVVIARRGVDKFVAVDVTLTCGYGYWVAATWLVVYAVVFWAPRIL